MWDNAISYNTVWKSVALLWNFIREMDQLAKVISKENFLLLVQVDAASDIQNCLEMARRKSKNVSRVV